MLVLITPSGYGTFGTIISAKQNAGYVDFSATLSSGTGIATFFANLEIRVYP
jgi:hypothetical protein